MQNLLIIAGGQKRFDDPHGRRRRMVILHNDPDHADRAINSSPRLAIDVEPNEEISREERPPDFFNSPCVSPGLLSLGKKDGVILISEVSGGCTLAMRLTVNRIPPSCFHLHCHVLLPATR